MAWRIIESSRVRKQAAKLPPAIRAAYEMLLADLEDLGPEVPKWHHFGKLAGGRREPDMYHCHLNKGKPRYVVVWRVNDYAMEIMEVRYAGTHEGADYKRIR